MLDLVARNSRRQLQSFPVRADGHPASQYAAVSDLISLRTRLYDKACEPDGMMNGNCRRYRRNCCMKIFLA
jgi:hypothetical protein